LYLVPLPPYVKVNEEEVVFEDSIESGKVPESAFGLLKTYWNLAWFGGIHVLLQWKVPKGDPNFSPKLFLDNSELTVIKNSFSQVILEQLSVNLNKSKVEITTCFNEFSEYESTNFFHHGSCHLDKASNVEIGVECQIFIIVIFFNCDQVLKFGAHSRYYKGALTQKK
jgi:hypothetical protein